MICHMCVLQYPSLKTMSSSILPWILNYSHIKQYIIKMSCKLHSRSMPVFVLFFSVEMDYRELLQRISVIQIMSLTGI